MDHIIMFLLGAAAIKAVPVIDNIATKARVRLYARIRKFRANPGLE